MMPMSLPRMRPGTSRCSPTLPSEARLGGTKRRRRNVESDKIDVRGRIVLWELRIGDGAGWRRRRRRQRQDPGLGLRPRPAAFVAVAAGDERSGGQQVAAKESQLACAAQDRREDAPASQVTGATIG